MSKDAKALGLTPKLSSNQKKVFSALSTFGACTIEEISQHSGLSKGRVSSSLETLEKLGVATPIAGKSSADNRYVAIYPIEQFKKVLDGLTNSLDARKSELEAITKVVNDFTETAIKKVREASREESEKRNERSEQDIKDLELAMDASLGGILASVEMDLKDLGQIAKTSSEFLVESSIRTDETCVNIKRGLEPVTRNFARAIGKTREDIIEKLSATVDARVSDVLDLETAAGKAFAEVLDAFSDSQEAFEEIIFTVLDTGIEDLERVTRPINEQIEEAISTLTAAIRKAADYARREILRVLTEQKRPMAAAVESIRPASARIASTSLKKQQKAFKQQFSSLDDLVANHSDIFIKATENLAKEYDSKLVAAVDLVDSELSSVDDNLASLEEQFKGAIDETIEKESSLIHNTSRNTRDALADMQEQFIIILNRSIAMFQMELGDHLAALETEFLTAVESSAASIQNLANIINMTLTGPIKSAVENLLVLTKKMHQEQSVFVDKFDASFSADIKKLTADFQKETEKLEKNFAKDLASYASKFNREVRDNVNFLNKKFGAWQKDLQKQLKSFTDQVQKSTSSTNRAISATNTKLKTWHKDNSQLVKKKVDEQIAQSLNTLQYKMSTLIDGLNKGENVTKEDLLAAVKDSLSKVSKAYKDLDDAMEFARTFLSAFDAYKDTLSEKLEEIRTKIKAYDDSKVITTTTTPS